MKQRTTILLHRIFISEVWGFYLQSIIGGAWFDADSVSEPDHSSTSNWCNTYHRRQTYLLCKNFRQSDVNETEPEVLYTAVHHAREPESMSQLIYYMWYLLENYSADSTVRNLVNTTEMYFVPCVNRTDTFTMESTNPLGGGMWRKNRRDNLDGEFGVDLNRNYGEQWGLDNIGSSPLTSDGTYRGTSGFSEPETQAMKNFTNNHEFKLALNYHTYGNFHIVPWGYGYQFLYSGFHSVRFLCSVITKYNHFLVGTPNQTVNYKWKFRWLDVRRSDFTR